jgi:C-terminal processing protease CtpA/Prc
MIPWILSVVLAVWCAGLFLQLRELRRTAQAATEDTAAKDGTSAQVEAPPAPDTEKDESTAGERSELLRLRNEVHQLRESRRELEARMKAQEQQLSAAKAAQERAQAASETIRGTLEAIQIKPGMIGAMFTATGNQPMVRAVGDNSPAGRAGIKPGDVVLSVDGTNVSEMTFAQVMQAIRGDEGTQVILEIDDGTPNGRRQVTLVREKVSLQDIRVPAGRNGPDI